MENAQENGIWGRGRVPYPVARGVCILDLIPPRTSGDFGLSVRYAVDMLQVHSWGSDLINRYAADMRFV